MVYEIGSQFELDKTIEVKHQNADWLPNLGDTAFTFSGRTAIELALEDISRTRQVESVYMPSYCCASMVDPFIKKGIDVQYYDVSYCKKTGLKYDIKLDSKCDIFFAMSYFGLEEFKMEAAIEVFIKREKVIIEDITHRLLCEQPYSAKAHYCIASLRKWFAVPTGGYVTKSNGTILNKPYLNSDDLVKDKIAAMHEKHQYLQGFNNEKESFLTKFKKFDQEIGYIDYNHQIDSLSLNIIEHLDIDDIKIKRRKNAAVLYKGLAKFKNIKFLFPEPDLNKYCPLFLPVMLSNEKRNELRKELVENKVYCPVHWPQKKSINNIWENELSIICDHRYNELDMKYILDVVGAWYKQNM
ncbi:hypothetical protein WKU33_17600 [Oceanobacillus sp. HCA-5259]|uniref:hypothetical protein n=1 Tax=Oceanobacillus sp. HCA-5259 TaxID=3134661 RepID=UPI0030C50684